MNGAALVAVLYGDGDRSFEVEALWELTRQLDPSGRNLPGVDALHRIVLRAEHEGRYVTPVAHGREYGPLIVGFMSNRDRVGAVDAIDTAISDPPPPVDGIDVDLGRWPPMWLGLRRGLMLPQDRPTGTALLRLWARPDLGAGERVGISQEVFDRYRAVVGHLAGNDRLTRYEALGADHHARAPDVAQRSVRL